MKTALINCSVFIGDGRVLDRALVVVEDGLINRVEDGAAEPPKDAKVIDLAGCMLAPGFIDCHVHLDMDAGPDPNSAMAGVGAPELALVAAKNAKNTLMSGVTTVRDMGADHGVDFAIRNAVAKGLIKGPRVLASGMMVCMTGGHGWSIGGREADGPDEVRKAVREQLKAGADQIKLMATGGVLTPGSVPGVEQMTLEELAAAVSEAHKAGRFAAAHAQGAEGIKNSLKAGMNTIEHGVTLDEEAIELMLEKGSFMVPTLAAVDGIMSAECAADIPEESLAKAKSITQTHLNSLRAAKKAGVAVAMGTDAGTPCNHHGKNLHELELLVEQGFTAAEALTAATGTAARAINRQGLLGLVEPGLAADLVAVKGDPLSDISLVTDKGNLAMIMQSGGVVGGSLLK